MSITISMHLVGLKGLESTVENKTFTKWKQYNSLVTEILNAILLFLYTPAPSHAQKRTSIQDELITIRELRTTAMHIITCLLESCTRQTIGHIVTPLFTLFGKKALWSESSYITEVFSVYVESIPAALSTTLVDQLLDAIKNREDEQGSITSLKCLELVVKKGMMYSVSDVMDVLFVHLKSSTTENVVNAVKSVLEGMVFHGLYKDQPKDILSILCSIGDIRHIECAIKVLECVEQLTLSKEMKSLEELSGENEGLINACLGLTKDLMHNHLRQPILKVFFKVLSIESSGDRSKIIESMKSILMSKTVSISDFVACGLCLQECLMRERDFLTVVRLFGETMECTDNQNITKIVFSKILMAGAKSRNLIDLKVFCEKFTPSHEIVCWQWVEANRTTANCTFDSQPDIFYDTVCKLVSDREYDFDIDSYLKRNWIPETGSEKAPAKVTYENKLSERNDGPENSESGDVFQNESTVHEEIIADHIVSHDTIQEGIAAELQIQMFETFDAIKRVLTLKESSENIPDVVKDSDSAQVQIEVAVTTSSDVTEGKVESTLGQIYEADTNSIDNRNGKSIELGITPANIDLAATISDIKKENVETYVKVETPPRISDSDSE